MVTGPGGAPADDPFQLWGQLTGAGRTVTWSRSLERRWFGPSPPEVAEPTLGRLGTATEQRVDRYARLGRPDMNLKLRDGRRAGLKVRRCSIDLGDGLPPAERWTRRSAPLAVAVPDGAASWWTVLKDRSRAVVDLSGPVPVRCEPGGRRPRRGGAVEVVRIDVPAADVTAWSVAVESWGADDVAGLRRLSQWVDVDWTAVERWSVMTSAYPSWIEALTERENP
jgi:hypothetical protein